MDNHKLATRNPFVLYYNAIPIYLHIFTLDGKLLIFFKPKFSIFPGKIFFPWTKSIDFLFLYPFPWDLMVQRIVFSRRPISVERPPDGSHVHAVALAVSLGTGSSPRLLFSLSLSLCVRTNRLQDVYVGTFRHEFAERTSICIFAAAR